MKISETKNGKTVSLELNGHNGWAIMVDGWLACEKYNWEEAIKAYNNVLANL